MNNKLYNKLFSFDIESNKNIYISNNGIYPELILYLFSNTKKDLL